MRIITQWLHCEGHNSFAGSHSHPMGSPDQSLIWLMITIRQLFLAQISQLAEGRFCSGALTIFRWVQGQTVLQVMVVDILHQKWVNFLGKTSKLLGLVMKFFLLLLTLTHGAHPQADALLATALFSSFILFDIKTKMHCEKVSKE